MTNCVNNLRCTQLNKSLCIEVVLQKDWVYIPMFHLAAMFLLFVCYFQEICIHILHTKMIGFWFVLYNDVYNLETRVDESNYLNLKNSKSPTNILRSYHRFMVQQHGSEKYDRQNNFIIHDIFIFTQTYIPVAIFCVCNLTTFTSRKLCRTINEVYEHSICIELIKQSIQHP